MQYLGTGGLLLYTPFKILITVGCFLTANPSIVLRIEESEDLSVLIEL